MLGIPIMAGRAFTPSDVGDVPTVGIINEAFAAKFGLDPRDAVGKRMSTDSRGGDLDMEIVGIIQNAKYSEVKDEVPPTVLHPLSAAWRHRLHDLLPPHGSGPGPCDAEGSRRSSAAWIRTCRWRT